MERLHGDLIREIGDLHREFTTIREEMRREHADIRKELGDLRERVVRGETLLRDASSGHSSTGNS